MIEGDTALTPDQGPTGGSSGVMRGGVQIRQAAATAREALLALAATRAGRPASDFIAIDGEVRPKTGGAGYPFGDLLGARRFGLKLDPKAPLRSPETYTIVGKPLARPDVPGKVTGRHVFMHDFKVDGMLHGRVLRPSSVGAKVTEIDESSIARHCRRALDSRQRFRRRGGGRRMGGDFRRQEIEALLVGRALARRRRRGARVDARRAVRGGRVPRAQG